MASTGEFFTELNRKYLEVHRQKEELFWSTYMGTSTDNDAFVRAEQRWKEWISDRHRLDSVREQISRLQELPVTPERKNLVVGLRGWQDLFEANIFKTEEAKNIWHEAVEQAATLFSRRSGYSLSYTDESGKQRGSSLLNLFANISAAPSEEVRKTSRDALLGLGDWVLENGFLELVETRNRFARASGYRNYFEYSVRKNERMSVEQLFGLLDELEEKTRAQNARSLADLRKNHGNEVLQAHNTTHAFFGDTAAAMDAYLPFATSLETWISSISRMNIDFAGAELTLDLLERTGKFENGFCHGPVPAFLDNGVWIPAKVNFTATARPDLVGSGQLGLQVLFHEGGHAAHFANVRMNAPCFSQEFAPTSMAYAETQSMFCDSLLEDADWLSIYARDRSGTMVPRDLIRLSIEGRHRGLAFDFRNFLMMPYFERALYELEPDARTPATAKRLAREIELRILGYEVSQRPLLSVPHLLSNDSACSSQGYLVALVAVYQIRAHFVSRYGHLADNPIIGPQLASHFWEPGNSRSLDEALRNLTGQPLTARYLAEEYALTVEEAVKRADRLVETAAARDTAPVRDVNAKIRVVDGSTEIASNKGSLGEMFGQFASFIDQRYPVSPGEKQTGTGG